MRNLKLLLNGIWLFPKRETYWETQIISLDAKEYDLSSPVIVGTDLYLAAKVKRCDHYEIGFGYSECVCMDLSGRFLSEQSGIRGLVPQSKISWTVLNPTFAKLLTFIVKSQGMWSA